MVSLSFQTFWIKRWNTTGQCLLRRLFIKNRKEKNKLKSGLFLNVWCCTRNLIYSVGFGGTSAIYGKRQLKNLILCLRSDAIIIISQDRCHQNLGVNDWQMKRDWMHADLASTIWWIFLHSIVRFKLEKNGEKREKLVFFCPTVCFNYRRTVGNVISGRRAIGVEFKDAKKCKSN